MMQVEGPAAVVAAADTQVEQLLAAMTLEEKASLTVGRDAWTTQPVERLGIPSVWLSDGPTGVRRALSGDDISIRNVPATCFPTESALGASWDVCLVRDVARAIGLEAQAQGVQLLLGPGVNLKRSPLCGRNFEYFSEDPALSGELAAAYVGGLQEQGVGSCLKHLVANESETDRMVMDSQVDERTLREVYLRPFEIAIAKAAPWALMAAYNRLNGTPCVEQTHLLRDIVAREWQYQGIVVSDWGAVDDRVAAIAAGLHLQMPGGPGAAAIVEAVRQGKLDESSLNEIVRPLLAFVLKAGAARRSNVVIDREAHHRLAKRAAAESIVLLKNDGGLLPLEGDHQADLALIGAFCRAPRYQGTGSSHVEPAHAVETIFDELSHLVGPGGRVTYADGYTPDDATNPALLQEAQAVASGARTAIVVVGLPASYESEGFDRHDLALPPGHDALVEAVQQVQPRTVVVLLNGAPVTLPWVSRVPAIVEGWLAGQGTGGAIAEVLLGRVNPSGKLAETFPLRLVDTPSFLSFPHDGTGRATFAEGLFTGYRWFDARSIEPLFPFGHGLSYTAFAYDDLTLDKTILSDSEPLAISLRVRNTGTRAGQDIVQLYVRERRPRLPRPVKELRAFAKVALEPGKDTIVSFRLEGRDFAVYDPRVGAWTTPAGGYDLLVGASSRDIRLQASVCVEPVQEPDVHLDRTSPVREWLRLPLVRERLQPFLADLGRRLSGAPAGAPVGESQLVLAETLVNDMPIGRLILLGGPDDADIAELIAAIHGYGSAVPPGSTEH